MRWKLGVRPEKEAVPDLAVVDFRGPLRGENRRALQPAPAEEMP